MSAIFKKCESCNSCIHHPHLVGSASNRLSYVIWLMKDGVIDGYDDQLCDLEWSQLYVCDRVSVRACMCASLSVCVSTVCIGLHAKFW